MYTEHQLKSKRWGRPRNKAKMKLLFLTGLSTQTVCHAFVTVSIGVNLCTGPEIIYLLIYDRTHEFRKTRLLRENVSCQGSSYLYTVPCVQSDPYSLDLHSESMSVSERIQTVDLWSEHRLSMVRANLEWALRRGATCHVPVSIGYRLHPQKYVSQCLYSRNHYN